MTLVSDKITLGFLLRNEKLSDYYIYIYIYIYIHTHTHQWLEIYYIYRKKLFYLLFTRVVLKKNEQTHLIELCINICHYHYPTDQVYR